MGQSGRIMDQSKTKTLQGKLQNLPVAQYQLPEGSSLAVLLTASPGCLSQLAPSLRKLSLLGRYLTGFWHLQHLRVSNTIQTLLSQPHIWLLWASIQELPCHTPGLRLFLTAEEDSTIPLLLYPPGL